MRLDDGFDVVHSNPQPFFLGSLKWLKEASPYEFRGHSASVVLNGENNTIFSQMGLYVESCPLFQ